MQGGPATEGARSDDRDVRFGFHNEFVSRENIDLAS
jgi:hypothetical protein